MAKDITVLPAKSVLFYSQNDEAAFFEWLGKLESVSKYDGTGGVINIHVRCKAVDEGELRELLALFHRYGIDMKPLLVFDRKEFAHWFRDKRSYWFRYVF